MGWVFTIVRQYHVVTGFVISGLTTLPHKIGLIYLIEGVNGCSMKSIPRLGKVW